jgi:DNA polymerase elongation subunit (family B)
MATLVFDIETSAIAEDNFDESQIEYLFRPAESLKDAQERDERRELIQRQFNLWPFTAQVVCIAMQNVETGRGKSLFLADDFEENNCASTSIEFVPCMDESELLSEFWAIAPHYDRIVTFNGRSFDIPFLYLRSALLNVPISQKKWLGYRFQVEPHCDLAEQLTFYNVSGRTGAARRFNLDFYCRAFGIESPKSQGVTGMDVSDLMAQERYLEIAAYCARDVVATAELYAIWKERLEGVK